MAEPIPCPCCERFGTFELKIMVPVRCWYCGAMGVVGRLGDELVLLIGAQGRSPGYRTPRPHPARLVRLGKLRPLPR